MFHLILYQPEIPPNTGNIIRLCANTGTTLSLVAPLGFELDDRRLRRAGLDYAEFASVRAFEALDDCMVAVAPNRVLALSTRGAVRYSEFDFAPGDALLFGPETRGLPQAVLDLPEISSVLRLPMLPGNRSLNLSNAAAVVLYEAWRQHDFAGGN